MKFVNLCSDKTDSELNIDVYLDYFNNYLTVKKMARDYGLSSDQMLEKINRGKFWNNTLARNNKGIHNEN